MTRKKKLLSKKKDDTPEENAVQAAPPPTRPHTTPQNNTSNEGPPWLISFTDIMALMLTFFVLLFSMSNPKKDAWTDVITALDSEFNKYFSAKRAGGVFDDNDIDRLTAERTLNLNYLEALIARMTSEYEELKDVSVRAESNRIVISLPSSLLFTPGNANVSDAGRQVLFHLGSVLGNILNPIDVQGFTDPDPVSGGIYASNWHLSLARAASVAAELDEAGYEREITITGFADGRFDQIDPDLPQAERYERARRVDIIVRGS